MCGIIGITGSEHAAKEVYLGLFTLQHRGQDAAGILSYDDGTTDAGAMGFHMWKDTGLVDSIFDEAILERLTGSMAIGHTRYSTVGSSSDKSVVQPFALNFPYGIGMCHNGNIVNVGPLLEKLRTERRRHFLSSSDLEVIQNLFADKLAEVTSGDSLTMDQLAEAVRSVFDQAVGGYSVVSSIAGQGLIGFRDPQGIRPLALGKKTENGRTSYCLSSESIVFSILGYETVRDLKAGELVFIDAAGRVESRQLVNQTTPTPCMFEWVYFAGAESVLEGKPVYGARLNLGKGLAKLVKAAIDKGEIKPDIVVPVPETSRIAAIGIAEELGLPYREVLIKNRYIQRSFILSTQDKRTKAVDLKLNPVRTEIEGKNVLLVDDSIVRGTTSLRLINLVRRAGAKEVYFASTCPPIRQPCYYGIDFPSPEELLATNRTEKEIAEKLNADRVIYLDHDSLRAAIGLPSICMACLDGRYPTDVSAGKRFTADRAKQRSQARV